MAKVLVTCVGSGVGQSAIDSLVLSGTNYIIGCDSNRDVYAYQKCNDFEISPSIYSKEYIGFLLEVCRIKGVDVIIPGHDHELSLFAHNIKKFDEQNIQVIVSGADVIEISRDKFEWYRVFKSRDISIVSTYRVKDFKLNPDPSILPAIIKPSGGSASQGISIINDLDEIGNLSDDDIIQPYLFPEINDPNYDTIHKFVDQGKFVQMSEISIQIIFSKDSEFEGIFISKNTLKSGIPVFVNPIQPEKFKHLDEVMKFVPILKEYKVKGPVNIQGRITDYGLFFFEMNMRFTGITGNRAQLGFNEVEYSVNNFLGKPAELTGYSDNKIGARQVSCTVIPRLSKTKPKKNIIVLGIENDKAQDFLKTLAQRNDFSSITTICQPENYKDLQHLNHNDNFQLISSENNFLQTIYCKTDVLIYFNHNSNIDLEMRNVLFFQEQLKYVLQANIPLIINAYDLKLKSNLTKIISNFFSYLPLLSPAVRYEEHDCADSDLNHKLFSLINNF